MNDNDILATGTLCAALLVSSDFKQVVSWYEQSIAAAFLSTGSGDTAKREELYANLWGARDLLTFIETTAAAAKSHHRTQTPQHYRTPRVLTTVNRTTMTTRASSVQT